MFRGSRGGNRRSFDKLHDTNIRGNSRDRRGGGSNLQKKESNQPLDGNKTEWVSYTRPVSSEKPESKDDESALLVKEEPSISNGVTDTKVLNKDVNISDEKLQQDMASSSDSAIAGKNVGKPGEKKFSGRCRLFVANMNNNTTEDELRQLFAEFGETGELFINKEKGFGFIRMDYRHNAELAKSALDKKVFKGRCIQVRFATHASAVELHGLDEFASNEYIEQAMNQFGNVERAVVVCDDRGRSKGYAIVEFEWKKSAQKVLDRFKEEMFVLGRLPKPIFAKPRSQLDEEEGLHEEEIEKNLATKAEREFTPRFISPSSFEYTWAKKWRDLYIEEEDKKAKLDQELQDARYQLEMEMEAALREQEAAKIREGMIAELQRRQEELRRLEEEMRIRQEMNQRAREQLDRNRQKAFEERKTYSPRHQQAPPPRDTLHAPSRNDAFPDNLSRQNEMILHQQAELEMRRGELLRVAGMQPAMLSIRPELLQGPANSLPQLGGPPLGALPQHVLTPGLSSAMPPGPRGPPSAVMPPMQGGGMMRPHMLPEGPPPRRDFSPRGGGERFDHKRPRRE